jgi:hypothetical protein
VHWLSVYVSPTGVQLVNVETSDQLVKHEVSTRIDVRCQANIQQYLKGCVALRISGSDLFTIPDLHNGNSIPIVCNA